MASGMMKDLAERMKVERILEVCYSEENKLKMWQGALFNEEPLSPFEVMAILKAEEMPCAVVQV